MKLTDEQRVQIRVAYAAGGVTKAALGRQYGVSRCVVRDVIDPEAERARNRERRAANLEAVREYQRVCARKYRASNREAFRAYDRARRAGDLDAARRRVRERYAANPEAVREYNRRWASANAETLRASKRRYRARALAAQGEGIPTRMFGHWLDAWGGRCAYCGVDGPLTIDHITPLTEGGSHEPHNLAPACASCNSTKGARDPETWCPHDALEIRVRAARAADVTRSSVL